MSNIFRYMDIMPIIGSNMSIIGSNMSITYSLRYMDASWMIFWGQESNSTWRLALFDGILKIQTYRLNTVCAFPIP